MSAHVPIDPVCGMTVDPAHAAGTSTHNGRKFYFCSKGCKAKFDADPAAFAGGKKQPGPAATKGGDSPANGQWTCPMHPEVVRDAPGSCPICGMALEPRTVTLEDEKNPELTTCRGGSGSAPR